MLKKVSIATIIFVILVVTISIQNNCSAVTGEEVLNSEQATELVEIKESTKAKLAEYVEKYGSATFGMAAYILDIVRVYSIPFCFIGIAIGSYYYLCNNFINMPSATINFCNSSKWLEGLNK